MVDYLSPGFVFYPFDLDDIKQHARYEALRALKGFNPLKSNKQAKPGTTSLEEKLRAFLFRHVKNRLINLQRDKRGNIEQKKNLNRAGSIYNMDESHEAQISFEEDVDKYDVADMKAKILENLDGDLRHVYHKVLANLSVPKIDRDRLFKRIKQILGVEEEIEDAEEL